jgi:uncharacterized pyridoxal phosphate-containing UPF0001 family protein
MSRNWWKRGNSLISMNIRWHCIGHLQSNKVKYIADWIHMIHSVDSVDLAKEIQKSAERSGRDVSISLVEVNTSEEATKFGVRPDGAAGIDRQSVRHFQTYR